MRHYIEQRSEEWFRLRLGKVTSTRMKTVAHGSAEKQTKLLNLMQWEVEQPDKAVEQYLEGFGYKTPSAIRLGREREDWLIARYEIMCQQAGRKVNIDRPGLVVHPSIPEFADSPDWLTDDRAGEGKTRTDQTKHEYALKHGLLGEDKDQCYCHMMVSGYEMCDYVSYCPDWPEVDTKIAIVEVQLDQIYANYLYAELTRFLQHFREGTRPTMSSNHMSVPSFFD